MGEVLQRLQKLQIQQDEICRVLSGKQDTDKPIPREYSHKLKHVKQADSLLEITEILPNVKMHYSSELSFDENQPDGLCCTTCTPEIGKGDTRNTGVFIYDSEKHGSSFKSKPPDKFRQLRRNVAEHMVCPTHLEREESQKKEESLKQKKADRNYEIGMRSQRNVYKSMLDCSYTSFEREMAKDCVNGLDMGDINVCYNFFDYYYYSEFIFIFFQLLLF